MRRRGYRRGAFVFATAPRIETQGQRSRNPVPSVAYGTQVGIGYQLAERPANIRADIESKRRELQEKYRQEAAEAEEKRLRKEKKKREEWLKRQESLVRPGYRLGHGTQPSNLQRDLVEHQNATGYDPQEGRAHEEEADEQLRMLVQQGIERGIEAESFDRYMHIYGMQIDHQQKREAMMRRRGNRPFGSANNRGSTRYSNFPSDDAPSTPSIRGSANNRGSARYSNFPPSTPTTRGSSNNRGSARYSNFAPNDSPATSSTRGSANSRKPANFQGVTANASSSTSDTRASGNPRKPENFLGVAQASSAASNTNVSGNPRKPENFLGVAQASSATSNTNVSGNPRKPENFLGVAQAPSATSNTNVSGNPWKPENFLGVAQNFSSPTSNINDTHQGTSGNVLGHANNVPTSSHCDPEVDYREQMRAARLRMQEKYNEHLRNTEQEVNNMAEGVQQVSLK